MSVKMLFISGHSRGGSTLLTTLLSQLEGYFAMGEMRRIWQGGFIDNELCTCGQPFHSCDFWNAVISEAFGNLSNADAHELALSVNKIYVAKNFLPLMFPSLQASEFNKKRVRLVDAYEELYRAIQKISGCSVLVDSSKVGAYGLLLNQISFYDLYILHLNRHSCAVAYSNAKKKRRLEVHWKEAYMLQRTPSYSAVTWVKRNLSTESLRLLHKPYKGVKYETLADAPIDTLKQITRYVGQELSVSDLEFFVNSHRFEVRQSGHMFGGNPMRFQGESREISVDNAWRTKMPFSHKVVVKFLTYPMLLRYGYF